MTAAFDFDVAIAGLGAMGSAAAYHLARRGVRVIGFDRFAPPHALGSSHGESRIIREAYIEGPAYVPIVQRAYVLWRELERASGERLLLETGGLMMGGPASNAVLGARASAETHGLPHEVLDAPAIARRFPAMRPDADTLALWEPRAGMLFPERCVAAHLAGAIDAGATLRVGQPVEDWRAVGDGVEVTTAAGTIRARNLVLAAGAWLPRLMHADAPDLTVARQPLFWFVPRAHPEHFAPGRFPIFIWQSEPDYVFYGFPMHDGRVKVTRHAGGEATQPDAVDRAPRASEVAALRERLARYLPDLDAEPVEATVCMYTNTADEHFLIDRHPRHAQVTVVSACSGHGFKFASAIGEIVAGLATGSTPPADLSLFRWRS